LGFKPHPGWIGHLEIQRNEDPSAANHNHQEKCI
jgi:hypothetical protein